LERDLEFLCANPDRQVRVGSQLIWCAGALADAYEALGGRVILAGKPHAPIYTLARAEVPGVADPRILAIGDGLSTDVLGANQQGLDCLFVAGGLLGDGLMAQGALDPDKVSAALTAAGAQARYVMAELK
jgi:HAD superfamily hydrolase (TIGR01459 family)